MDHARSVRAMNQGEERRSSVTYRTPVSDRENEVSFEDIYYISEAIRRAGKEAAAG